MQTELEELPENRVRLRVQVPRDDVHHAIEHAATDLAASVKIPGFRKGKVPMPVLLQRVGKDRLYTEAIESHIGGWFWSAAARQRLRPVEPPQYDFELPTSDGEDWEFTATVAVQAKPEIVDWTTLEVPYREPQVPQQLVDQELSILQDTVATLAPVEGRPVQERDTVVIDLVSGDETRTDYVVELGRGAVVEEIEQGLVAMSVGDSKEIEFELGDDSSQSVAVTVKEIKEKVLPPLDDELARAATEFDTIAELRGDIEKRLREQLAAEADAAFRADVVDKLVEASKVEAAGPLVESRTRELVAGLARQVERRGLDFQSYLTMTGTDPNELVARLRAEAAQSVARELALEAVAVRAGIEVSDDEVKATIREQAEEAGEDPEPMIEEVWTHGQQEALREDLRLRAALDRLAADVKPISVEQAEAREKLWTPDKEKAATETKLWTPGSKEHA